LLILQNLSLHNNNHSSLSLSLHNKNHRFIEQLIDGYCELPSKNVVCCVKKGFSWARVLFRNFCSWVGLFLRGIGCVVHLRLIPQFL
jgi:hypothetical protein